MMLKIGVISDTHGLLRPEAIKFLNTRQLIVHAGDIGGSDILEKLKSMAPTFAVRGNMDYGSWAQQLPEHDVLKIADKFLYLIHDLGNLDIDPADEFDIVISGHSHQPERYEKDGVLYFNPGSAGPRRHRRPISMGCITIKHDRLESKIITLNH